MRQQRVRSWIGIVTAGICLAMMIVGHSEVLGAQQNQPTQRAVAATRNTADDARVMDEMLARRVTITLSHVSRSAAIDGISQVAKVFVQYRARMLNTNPNLIDVRAKDLSLGTVLEHVLEGTGLHVASDGHGGLMIMPANRTASNDSVPVTGTVTGRVVDSATGRGVSNVTVSVAGIKISQVTQDSGRFVLKNIPVGQQVVIAKTFGYRPSERTVDVSSAQSLTIRIVLVPALTVLSGVVTTATGLQRKVEVGNDITTLAVDSIMQIAPISSLTDLLETRVPGLTVTHSSGVPGDPSRLRLRGAGSIQLNNDPIMIVDGIRVYASQSDPRNVNLAPSLDGGSGMNGLATAGSGAVSGGYAAPSPLDQIDPNIIETIEVFKGPSATAIYGSDAANGVIVITTKRGRAGQTQWNLALDDGVNWLPGSWPVNYFRFGDDTLNPKLPPKSVVASFCVYTDVHCKIDSIVAFQALNDPRYTVFSHGSERNASLSVQGGVSNLTYSLIGSVGRTVGYLKLPAFEQQRYVSQYGAIPSWMIRPDNLQTWSVGGSLLAAPTHTLQVTLTSSLFNSTQQRSSLEQAISQLSAIYIGAGFVSTGGITSGGPLLLSTTPLVRNEVERATAGSLGSRNAVSLNWTPKPWLPMNGTAGIDFVQRDDGTYIPFGVDPDGVEYNCATSEGCRRDTSGFYGLGRGASHDQTLSIGSAVPLPYMTFAFGGEFHSVSTADFSVFSNQLAPGVDAPTSFLEGEVGTSTVIINSPSSQSTSSSSTYGWYLEPRLKVASRVFVSPGFRLDGGSGASTSGGSVGGLSGFPKLDFSYIAVDRQNGAPALGFLTMLRPRVAFGYAGVQPAPADKLRLLNPGTFILEPAGEATLTQPSLGSCTGVCLSSLGNTQLRPERSAELEGGFDADLWDGRLHMTYSVYDKDRKDAILVIPVAPEISGFDGAQFNIQKNIGEIRNTGTNISLDATVLQTRTLSWSVTGNFSQNKNSVVRLNAGQAPLCLGVSEYPCQGTRVVAGYPLDGIWALPIVSFVDANHDGKIQRSEVRLGDSAVYVGQADPKNQSNVSTHLTLFGGSLGLNAEFSVQSGLTQENVGACKSGAVGLWSNAQKVSLATQAALAVAVCRFENGVVGSEIGLIQTVNTFRFNSLSINYTVPRAMSTWFRVPHLVVALQGSNLGLHSNYRGKDPEVNAFSTVSGGDYTADFGQIPEPRVWVLRITCGN